LNLTVKNEITITNYAEDEYRQITNSLTLINPKWDMATRLNKSLWGIPPKLKYYRIENDALVVPVGILDGLLKIYPDAEVKDERLSFNDEPDIEFTGTLHDYQEEAFNELVKHTNGILSAPTASGKTACMIKLLVHFKQPTLIMVNTLELANQFIDRLVQFTNLKKSDIGILGMGRRDIKYITVGLLQTITGLEDIPQKFGMIICDETHIAPAETYATAISKFDSLYKFGMSATPERSDGLTKVIFWLTGELLYTISGVGLSTIVKPTFKSIETDYYFPLFDTSEYQDMITDLSKNEERNNLIIKQLEDYPTQQIIMLCQRIDQILLLRDKIPDSVILISSQPKRERIKIMNDLMTQKSRVIISTFQLFSTGIDIPTLEVLVICAPVKSKVLVKQAAGRLMRTTPLLPNKSPIIIDFVDPKIELLKIQSYTRHRILRNL
jgi:superfamily II DNA or RNA helicase